MMQDNITVVSGLPRSGTSMMMGVLVAGGMKALTDDNRTADEDNPKGYFEFQKVKELERDRSWLGDARGKVLKIISALLKHLPLDYNYKVLFMDRSMEEILASQRQMLIRRGEPTDRVSDEKMAAMFAKHLRDVESWLSMHPNFEVIHINYNEVLKNPALSVASINRFLGDRLDTQAMLSVVDPTLYRQRT